MAANRGQWRAELVRDIGHQLALGLERRLDRLLLGGELGQGVGQAGGHEVEALGKLTKLVSPRVHPLAQVARRERFGGSAQPLQAANQPARQQVTHQTGGSQGEDRGSGKNRQARCPEEEQRVPEVPPLVGGRQCAHGDQRGGDRAAGLIHHRIRAQRHRAALGTPGDETSRVVRAFQCRGHKRRPLRFLGRRVRRAGWV